MKISDISEFSFMNFDSENGYQIEFKDNNEKSCSWSRNRYSQKIDFKAVWPRNGHADSVGVNSAAIIRSQVVRVCIDKESNMVELAILVKHICLLLPTYCLQIETT